MVLAIDIEFLLIAHCDDFIHVLLHVIFGFFFHIHNTNPYSWISFLLGKFDDLYGKTILVFDGSFTKDISLLVLMLQFTIFSNG